MFTVTCSNAGPHQVWISRFLYLQALRASGYGQYFLLEFLSTPFMQHLFYFVIITLPTIVIELSLDFVNTRFLLCRMLVLVLFAGVLLFIQSRLFSNRAQLLLGVFLKCTPAEQDTASSFWGADSCRAPFTPALA